MFRFLHSFHRAFRQQVHKPRPSAAVVDEDKPETTEATKSEEQTSSAHLCPYVVFRQQREKLYKPPYGHGINGKNSNNNAVLSGENAHHDHDSVSPRYPCPGVSVGEPSTNTGEDGRRYWYQCRQDFWSLVQGTSHRITEAISMGSLFFWGGDSAQQQRRTRLLYRVLFAMPGHQSIQRNTIGDAKPVVVTPDVQAEAKSNDTKTTKAEIKKLTVEEELDAAFEELHKISRDFSAINESQLGLEAWQEGNLKSGVEHLRESAALGHPSACYNMGLFYEMGTEVKADINKAQTYYKLAAAKGHNMAMYNLALIYFSLTPEEQEVEQRSKGKSEKTQEPEVCHEKEALQLMEKAANLGLAEAQTYMGCHHMFQTQDSSQALHFLKAAAQQKDSEGQYFLACCYDQGWGVDRNECRAAVLFSQAAAGGHELAMCRLAQYSENGMGGLPEDKVFAKDLYTKSAALGNEEAKSRLEGLEAQEKVDFWRDKLSAFKELYKVHHKQDSKVGYSNPLSPSSSSPNLTEHTDVFFQDSNKKKGNSLNISFEKNFSVSFTLGDSLDRLNNSLDKQSESSTDSSFDSNWSGSGDELSFSVSRFHKSNTVPNLAVL